MAGKDFFVNVRFTGDVYRQLHSEPHKASRIVRDAVKAWMQYFKLDEKRVELRDNENYAIIGRLDSGKTSLVKDLLKNVTRKKIIFDPNKEYSNLGEVIKLTYEKPIAENDFVFKIWSERESKIIETYLDNIGSTESVVIQPDFDIQQADIIFLDKVLEPLLKVDDTHKRLIVFEEAHIYQKALPMFISQCLKKGIQSLVVSGLPLIDEIMISVTPVLGQTGIKIKDSSLPDKIKSTAMLLKPHEWIWLDKVSNSWKRHSIIEPSVKPVAKPVEPITKPAEPVSKPSKPVSKPVATENATAKEQARTKPLPSNTGKPASKA